MTRTPFFLLLILFLCFTTSRAQAGVIEFLFPSLRQQDADPSTTLEAPFAEKKSAGPSRTGTAQPSQKPSSLPENAIPMDQPHRNTSQITEWIINAAADALTFDKADSKTKLAGTRPYFNQTGREQYEAFLTETKLVKVLESEKYYIRSYVNDAPLLLNEGVTGGTYHWLYEVPVMVSYMTRASKGYKEGAIPLNQKMMITLQIGRSNATKDPSGLIVETWKGKVEKIDKQ